MKDYFLIGAEISPHPNSCSTRQRMADFLHIGRKVIEEERLLCSPEIP